jgi:hypothetical protein
MSCRSFGRPLDKPTKVKKEGKHFCPATSGGGGARAQRGGRRPDFFVGGGGHEAVAPAPPPTTPRGPAREPSGPTKVGGGSAVAADSYLGRCGPARPDASFDLAPLSIHGTPAANRAGRESVINSSTGAGAQLDECRQRRQPSRAITTTLRSFALAKIPPNRSSCPVCRPLASVSPLQTGRPVLESIKSAPMRRRRRRRRLGQIFVRFMALAGGGDGILEPARAAPRPHVLGQVGDFRRLI